MKQTDYQMYIAGEWIEATTKETFYTYNPANQEKIAKVPRGRQEDVDIAVVASKSTFLSKEWQDLRPSDRGRALFEIAQLIKEQEEELALIETLDTGKPISQAKADVQNAARYFEYYAGMADKILGETIPVSSEIIDFTVREPVGVSAHIIPWNYPIQITARGAAAALATGNTVIIKPAEDTPLSALKLAEIIEKVSLPKGAYQVITGFGNEAGEALVHHRDVNHITFTGSVFTGSQVMVAAAKNIVPVTLELGGKSPHIIFSDCHIEEAVNWVVRSIIQNAGQTCSAGSRILIESSFKDIFVEKVVNKMKTISIGPGIEGADLGPIISKRQFERIKAMVERATTEGANVVIGGKARIVEGYEGGYYYEPTVLEHVIPTCEIAQEEVFGPVVTVFEFETEEEAVQLANGTEYGLVTGIWTRDIYRAHRLAKQVKSGQVFINNYGAGGGVELPFGGYKKSGFGREKGLEALRNYTQLKNIAIKITE